MKNKTLGHMLIYTVMAFAQKGISVFFVPLYTSFLPPSEFGVVQQIISLGSIYILIITFAFDEASARMYFQHRNNPNTKSSVMGNIVIINLLFSIIGGTLLYLFNSFFYGKFVSGIGNNLIILSILFVVTTPIFSINKKLLRIKERAKHYALIMFLYTVVKIILSLIFLVIVDLDSIGYMLALTLTSSIFCVYSYIHILNEANLEFSKDIVKRTLKYSSTIMPHRLSSWGLLSFTNVAIGRILNSAAVGILNAINFIAIVLDVLSKAIVDAYQPWVYKKLETNGNGVDDLINIAHLIGLGFVILGFFLSLFSEEIIQVFIDNKYYSGIFIAPLLIFNSVVLFLGSLLVFVLYFYKDKTKYVSISTITGATINIALGLVLIPKYGVLGGVIALAIANIIVSILKQVFASKAIGRNVVFYGLYIYTTINMSLSLYLHSQETTTTFHKIILLLAEMALLGYVYKNKIINTLRDDVFYENYMNK